MLYSEFIENTNCKDNDYNYKVYKDLEVIYMNTDISKAEIYAYGKKLVNNEKSEEEKAIEKNLKNEIKEYKENIQKLNEEIKNFKNLISNEEDMYFINTWKIAINNRKNEIRYFKKLIYNINFILN